MKYRINIPTKYDDGPPEFRVDRFWAYTANVLLEAGSKNIRLFCYSRESFVWDIDIEPEQLTFLILQLGATVDKA